MSMTASAALPHVWPHSVDESDASHAAPSLDLPGLVLLRCRVHLLLRLAWLQQLWGGREPPEAWGWTLDQPDTQPAEAAWRAGAPETERQRLVLAHCQQLLDTELGRPRHKLAQLFNLSISELDCLDLAFALHADPALRRLVAAVALPAGQSRLDAALVRQVFCHARGNSFVWRPASGLSVWGLVKEHGAGGLDIDVAIASYLEGSLCLDPVLVSYARLARPRPALPYWRVESHAAQLGRILGAGQKLRCVVRARKSDQPLAFAARLCEELGVRLLSVSLPAGADGVVQGNVAVRAERLALLGNFAIAWQGFEWRFHPGVLSAVPLQFHFATDGETPEALRDCERIDWVIDLPPPPHADRVLFCSQVLERQKQPAKLSRDDVVSLARSRAASLDDLEATLAKSPVHIDEAFRYLTENLVRTDDELTGSISVPRREWSEIVLPEGILDVLKSVVFEAKERLELAASGRMEHGFGGGMPILLHGAPGTGKTLAAEIVASEVGCNLYTVDVASIVSKYVGETAKNLRRIFFEARNSSNVIFFDEADTFFVKRTEVRGANDKHANADTNYLLQLIEAHPGTTILATNRRNDIDPAFFRRMRYIIEFARPGVEERSRLWAHSLKRLKLEVDELPEDFLASLAKTVELSPAQIQAAVTSAYFLGRQFDAPVSAALLLRALGRELAKEGRVLPKRDLERITRDE